MSESVVRVDLRQATLSESARLRESDERVFLALDAPPPVRSLLRVVEGESARAFEVGRVIEVVDEVEPERGCYGHFVELEQLEQSATKVGSEHLSPGISNSGVPAPVVIMNTADMMLNEAGDEAEAAAAADADAQAAGANAEGDASAEGEGEAKTDADADAAEGDASAEAEGEAKAEGDAEGDAAASESSESSAD